MIPRRTLTAVAIAAFPEPYEPSQETADFRAVFLDTAQGQRVLAVLMQRCGFMASLPPTNGQVDTPMATVFNEGRRSAGEMIARILEREIQDPTQPKVVMDE